MLTALEDKVIIEPMFEPEMVGSLYIPDTSRARVNQGIVKYIGPSVTSVHPGDHVLFSGYSGTTMKLEGEGTVIIMPEKMITAVLIDEPFDIPGLYFKDKAGLYWEATYEFAMTLITKACEESPMFNHLKPREHKPSVAEIYASEDDR